MSQPLLTVEQASQELNLHPKTVLRYIRDKRFPAKRVGKSYRILRADLDLFAGIANRGTEIDTSARTTSITEIENITAETAERIATFVQSAALMGNADTPPLQLQTAFDPVAGVLKVVSIGNPSDVSRLLELLHLHLSARS